MKSPFRHFTRRSFIPVSLVLFGGSSLWWKRHLENLITIPRPETDTAAADQVRRQAEDARSRREAEEVALRRAEEKARREAEALRQLSGQLHTSLSEAGKADQESVRRIRAALKADLSTLCAEARQQIPAIGKVLSSFEECARMVLLMAKDQVTGSHEAADRIAMRTAGLRESLVQFQAARSSAITTLERDIGTHSNQLSTQVLQHVQAIGRSGEEDLLALSQRFGALSSGIQVEQMGLGISLALLPLDALAVGDLVLRVTRQLLGRYVERAAATAGANVVLAAADGPLPVGEIIAILLDAGFAVWTAWDLCHACKTIRPAIQDKMHGAVDGARTEIMAAFDQQAEAWLRDAAEKRGQALQPLLAAANPGRSKK
jgi:hypothetical protein